GWGMVAVTARARRATPLGAAGGPAHSRRPTRLLSPQPAAGPPWRWGRQRGPAAAEKTRRAVKPLIPFSLPVLVPGSLGARAHPSRHTACTSGTSDHPSSRSNHTADKPASAAGS